MDNQPDAPKYDQPITGPPVDPRTQRIGKRLIAFAIALLLLIVLSGGVAVWKFTHPPPKPIRVASFGADYQEYRGRAVPRFLPALGNLGMALRTTLPFGWELAWRKEGESCCGWLAGVVVLEAYEGVLARGWAQNWLYTQRWLVVLGLIGALALSLYLRKRLKPV